MLKLCSIALFGLLTATRVASADDGLVLPGEDTGVSSWTWFGDVFVRGDHVDNIPRPVDSNVKRVFARGRAGFLYDPIPALEFGAAIKLAAASNDNSEDRGYNNNERSNDVAVDQAFVRWRPGESTALTAGKAPFPLELSPMVWDDDLRPLGVSVQASTPVGVYNRFGVVAGYFDGNLPYHDNSRIAAIQAAYRWHEGGETSAAALLSYLDFSNLRKLTEQGLARTNRHVGDQLVSDFRLLDLQLVAQFHPGGWPLESRLDLLRNLGADDKRNGIRFSLVLGDRRKPHGWELGISEQRIQRDAAMAAFNSDDWWFHSWARGVMPWIGYGFNETWSMRLAEFHERRDGVDRYTDRVLLDLYGRW